MAAGFSDTADRRRHLVPQALEGRNVALPDGPIVNEAGALQMCWPLRVLLIADAVAQRIEKKPRRERRGFKVVSLTNARDGRITVPSEISG